MARCCVWHADHNARGARAAGEAGRFARPGPHQGRSFDGTRERWTARERWTSIPSRVMKKSASASNASWMRLIGSPRRKSVSRKELSSSIRLVKRAYQKHGISMPDEAREVVFPQGIPITMLDGKPASPPIIQVKLQIPGERSSEEAGVVSTKAEGGLQSEAGVLDEQARQAQPVREGENLLPNAPATIASEEPPPKPPKESGPSRTSQ
jgi:hypothetical protein